MLLSPTHSRPLGGPWGGRTRTAWAIRGLTAPGCWPTGLTADLAGVVVRAGFMPLRHQGRLLRDAACEWAKLAGVTELNVVEALTRQEGADRSSPSTVHCLRTEWPAPNCAARARTPTTGRPVVEVWLEATVIHAGSDKDGAEPKFKRYGFNPLSA